MNNSIREMAKWLFSNFLLTLIEFALVILHNLKHFLHFLFVR